MWLLRDFFVCHAYLYNLPRWLPHVTAVRLKILRPPGHILWPPGGNLRGFEICLGGSPHWAVRWPDVTDEVASKRKVTTSVLVVSTCFNYVITVLSHLSMPWDADQHDWLMLVPKPPVADFCQRRDGEHPSAPGLCHLSASSFGRVWSPRFTVWHLMHSTLGLRIVVGDVGFWSFLWRIPSFNSGIPGLCMSMFMSCSQCAKLHSFNVCSDIAMQVVHFLHLPKRMRWFV